MDYSNFAPHPQPYQFFVPPKPDAPYTTTQEDHHYDPLAAFSHPQAYPQFFDQNAHYPQQAIIPPAPAQSPPHALHRHSLSHAVPHQEGTPTIPHDMSNNSSNHNLELEYEQAQGRSSDDEKESLTPAQSRRKAQNRAAQRAFRERKERHVKELELKLKSMEEHRTEYMSDNERLKRELDRVATQNEILRATSSTGANSIHRSSSSNSRHRRAHQQHNQEYHIEDPDAPGTAAENSNITTGPLVYSPGTFNAAFADTHQPHIISTTTLHTDDPNSNNSITHRIAINNATGERLLSTGAAWDFIQHSDLFQKGVVDLGEVVDRLRERVVCDGAGPTFPESEVRKAIEECVGAVGDELI